jgi:hypothetical protein
MPPSPLARLRKLCLALPDAHEVQAWGSPTFRVNNKLFAMYAQPDNHHGAGHHAAWIKLDPVSQGFLIQANPKRYFKPPYVGTSGWIGVRLDGRVNWKDVAERLRDGYDMIVPKPKPRVQRGQKLSRASRSGKRRKGVEAR